MSPEHYRRFIRPWNKKLVTAAHGRGAMVVFHSDGNIWPIMEDLVEMGFDGVNPLEPDAGMALAAVKARYGDRLCLLGNIDCGDLLCNQSEAEVETAVREAIEAAAPGGGYVLCSSNSIHPGVKPENFVAMVRSAKKYGACY
jgi:uroporphyrinogen decarboxylase